MTRRDHWLRFRRRVRERRQTPVIEACWIEQRADDRYDLIVCGHGLTGVGGAPTLVTVGGRPVRRVDASDDTLLTGVVDGGEPGDVVEVELGPVGVVTGTLGDAP